MSPAVHVLISAGLGGCVYGVTGSWESGAAAAVAGVAPDADHALDYYNWFARRQTHRLYYLLHGWEYVAILLVVATLIDWHMIAVSATLGYTSHMLADYLASGLPVSRYSLLYRGFHRFRRRDILPHEIASELDGQFATLLQSHRPTGRILRWLLVQSLAIPSGIRRRRPKDVLG